MSRVRAAVVGCGHFGRHHAEKYAACARTRLVAVVDRDEAVARSLANRLGVLALTDPADLIGLADAASVAVPTSEHVGVARRLLQGGLHVLVEKPIATTLADASVLIALAAEHGRILQVGHLERFNAAVLALDDVIDRPLFIESHRIAPFSERGTDVDVVLDLMIHDIDLIQLLVGRPLAAIDAVGVPVLSGRDDIANARLRFAGGCVANVTASRVSYKTERRMRVFAQNHYVNCDLGTGKIFGYRLRGDPTTEGLAAIATETLEIPKQDSLANEIDAFLDCILKGGKPLVDGRVGSEALRVASMINESIDAHLKRVANRPKVRSPETEPMPSL
jgi:predicted dehydrogenase